MLYVSPLKALAVDVERNLRAPLTGITQTALRLEHTPPNVTVGVRSGDTSAADRRSIVSRPPDILITTPESLFLMLTSAARDLLRSVRTVIVDEVHALAGTKRGAHLALSLERLEALTQSSEMSLSQHHSFSGSGCRRPCDRPSGLLLSWWAAPGEGGGASSRKALGSVRGRAGRGHERSWRDGIDADNRNPSTWTMSNRRQTHRRSGRTSRTRSST